MRLAKTAVLLAVLLLAACGGGAEDGAPEATRDEAPPSEPTVPSQEPTTPTSSPGSRLQAVIDQALQDLSGRLGVSTDAIEVESAEAVTWPDGSLGCPEPGHSYTQALVEGFRVILRHEGEVYDYHAGSDTPPFLCEEDDVRVPPSTAPTR